MKFKGVLLILLVVLLTVSAASAATFDDAQELINNPDESGNVFLDNTTYLSNGREIEVTQSNIVIYGGPTPGDRSTLDGQELSGIMKITGTNVTLIGIDFINGNSTYEGGALLINNSANIQILNCTFINNKGYEGGAIFLNASSSVIENCIFVNNFARMFGGAISANGNDNTVINSFFRNNQAELNGGGAISWKGENGRVISNQFRSNSAFAGGAICWNGGDYGIVDSCTFDLNSAAYGGAVEWNLGENGIVTNCIFNKNTASELYGGAIDWYGFNATITNSKFEYNHADRGGAISIYENELATVKNCTFSSNSADYLGGAVFWHISPNGVITDCIFIENTAEHGGALYTIASDELSLTKSIFIQNSATDGGALLLVTAEASKINNCIFDENEAENGKAILYDSCELSLDYNFFATINNITEEEFIAKKLVGQLNKSETIYEMPENVAGLYISCSSEELEYVIQFSLINNDRRVDMPTYIAKVQINDKTSYLPTSKIHKFEDSGDIYIKAYSPSGELLAETQIYIIPINLTAPDVIKYYKGEGQYVVCLTINGTPVAGEKLDIVINNVSYKRTTDENGIAKVNINLSPGKYKATIEYEYRVCESNITVLPTVRGIDIVKYFKNDSQYHATFLDSSGKVLVNQEVYFNINGVIYTKTTDEHGIADLNINLNPGEYTLTALNPVTGEMRSNLIKVLPTLVGNDLEMTFKDGSTYDAKLVDGEGNPVKDAEITFNVNGVFYHKITDENGIAKLTINLNPGEYVITAIYKEAVTSNKIKVRA